MPVDYDCTSEASEEERNDDARDDDATSDSPEERWRQKNPAISNLIRGHQKLLVDLTKDEIQQGLMSSKLHRAAGQDGITAELVRAALPWLMNFHHVSLAMDSCVRARGPDLERRYDYYPLQESRPF